MEENNFSKLDLKDLLLYTPYDHLYAHRAILSENDFIERLRIIPDAYLDFKDNLMTSIKNNVYSIIYGYAGNGKTTFLYWFKEEIENEYNVDIINVIEYGQGFDLELTLVGKCLASKLWESFDILLFETVCGNREKLISYFDGDLLDSIQNYYQRYEEDNPSYEQFNKVLKETDLNQKLILYILNAILKQIRDNENLDDIKPYLLCFDNLDELKIKYLTDGIWEAILDATNKLNSIFGSLDISKGFDYTDKVRLLLVFRETNFAVGAAQANDRLSHIANQIRFFYTNNGREIMRKRIELYHNSRYGHRKFSEYNYDDDIRDLIVIILSDDILVHQRLMPLFNYDYRRFLDAITNIATPESISGKKFSLFNMPKEQYYNFLKNERMSNGRRGIFMNTFIRYLSNVNFLERIAPRTDIYDAKGHCNLARMFLTILCNLSFSRNQAMEEWDEKAEAEPVKVPLFDIYRYCKDIMTIDDFFDTIKSLIDFNKSSWAHLITIYDKAPVLNSNDCAFDFSSEKENLGKGKIDDLKKISISANASAYIYLRYILTHFEYVAAYKAHNKKDSIFDYEPLFLQTYIANFRELKWKFEETIEGVYKIVEAYYKRTEKFFNEVFIDKLGYTREQYCDLNSVYTFKSDYDSKIRNKSYYPFYMTRLLNTHIRYLDDFRMYINECYDTKLKEMITDKTLAASLKNKEAINSFIFNYIEKYIELLNKVSDPAIGDIDKRLREKLEEAKNNPDLTVEVEEEIIINK